MLFTKRLTSTFWLLCYWYNPDLDLDAQAGRKLQTLQEWGNSVVYKSTIVFFINNNININRILNSLQESWKIEYKKFKKDKNKYNKKEKRSSSKNKK